MSVSKIPVIIQAEDFVSESGIQLDGLRAAPGGVYVGYIDDTDSTRYSINVLESGTYTLEARVSSKTNGGTIGFRTADGIVGMLDINGTGGWFDWEVISTTVELEEGEHELTLDFVGGPGYLFNIDWFDLRLSEQPSVPPVVDPPTLPPVVDPPTLPPVVEPPTLPPVVEPPTIPPVVEPPTIPPVVEPPTIPPVVEPPEETTTFDNDLDGDSAEAASFLLSASFGPTTESIEELVDIGYSDWFQRQQRMPIDSILDDTNPNIADTTNQFWEVVPREIWYERAIYGDDQLRQRAAFALSQIFVVSTEPRNWLFKAHLHARYMDIMQEGVYGNFRDLMQNVTYSPLMGEWLTYIGNEKADAETGNAPDENYARELMQLFTIGLLELDDSGEPRLDSTGEIIETYDTEDVAELAKVFTGLWWDVDDGFGNGISRPAVRSRDIRPMVMFDQFHSPEEKSFLGHTIPAGTRGDESISQALDVLFEHPNVGPFIGKQLIQRLTTSNPSPDYVRRVTDAFNQGVYTLPDGTVIGSTERGDMAPVWAAILFDSEARSDARFDDITYGKVREPVIRWVHWARVAGDVEVDIASNRDLRLDGTQNTLGQNPFRARSVFNFYRPGFRAGGSLTAANDLVAPELQITTSTTAVQYPNFIRDYIFSDNNNNGWMASYDEQLPLATDADALVEHLNLTMTGGRMTDRTKQAVLETINSVNVSINNDTRRNRALRDRVQLAMLLVATSQEFNTQQ